MNNIREIIEIIFSTCILIFIAIRGFKAIFIKPREEKRKNDKSN